jgi:hypothetical protein
MWCWTASDEYWTTYLSRAKSITEHTYGCLS